MVILLIVNLEALVPLFAAVTPCSLLFSYGVQVGISQGETALLEIIPF